MRDGSWLMVPAQLLINSIVPLDVGPKVPRSIAQEFQSHDKLNGSNFALVGVSRRSRSALEPKRGDHGAQAQIFNDSGGSRETKWNQVTPIEI